MTAPVGGGSTIPLGTIEWDLRVRTEQLLAAGNIVQQTEQRIVASGQGATTAMADVSAQATKTAGALNTEAAAADRMARELAILKQGYVGAKEESAQMAARIQQLEAALGRKAATAEKSSQSLGKVRNGLVQIALASTNTTGAVGNLVQGMLLFGAGSAAVLGAAAAIALLAKGYTLLTAESQKAAEKVKAAREEQEKTRQDARTPTQRADDPLATLVGARIDLQERIAKLRGMLTGDGSDNARGANLTLNQQIAAAKKELDDLNKDIATARGTRGAAGAGQRSDDLQTLSEARRLGLASTADLARERDLIADLRKVEADTSKPLTERVEARRQLVGLAGEERDRARELQSILFAGQQAAADLTKGLTDNAILALRRFETEMKATIDRLPADQREAARASFDQQRVPLTENLIAARALDSVGSAESFTNLDSINEAMAQLVGKQHELTTGGQAYEAVQKRINDLEERKTSLLQADLTAGKIITDRTEAQRKSEEGKAKASAAHRLNQQEILDLVRDATRGALQLASAFGLVSAETAQILQDITNLGSQLPDLLDSISALKSGKGSAAAVLGAALPVVGTIATLATSLFGPDPADEERRRVAQENTKAIQKLTDTIGEFGLPGVTGAAFADARNAVEALGGHLGQFREPDSYPYNPDHVRQGNLEAALNARGTSRQELQDLSESLGLHVNFLTDDFRTLQDAFKKLGAAIKEVQLTQFTKTFSGQLSALSLEEEALRLTDPVALLERRRDLLGRGPVAEGEDPLGSPALNKALAGLDLNTAEGRAQAQANILAIVQALKDGSLKPEDLGGLDADQFTQAIRDILDLLKQADERTPEGENTSSFSVARLITDNQADQLIGLQVTSNVYLSEISIAATQIRDLMGGLLYAFTGIQPPVIPPVDTSGTVTSGGTTVVISGDINLTIQTAAGVTPTELGAAAADQIIDGLLARLGSDLRSRKLMYGKSGVT